MTLPASGELSFSDINVELGVVESTQASLGQFSFRSLAGVQSGAISMSDFYGKSDEFAFTISTNQTNVNLAVLAAAAGWDGSTALVATIATDVYCVSNSTANAAFTVSGSFPSGVRLINTGYIVGTGGAGGRGGGYSGTTGVAGSAGSAGGMALNALKRITIDRKSVV
jgi:hypothetical protein